ncbi:MAG: hypothetical protein ACI932_001313, partial [Paracoccaceae bacterium]
MPAFHQIVFVRETINLALLHRRNEIDHPLKKC